MKPLSVISWAKSISNWQHRINKLMTLRRKKKQGSNLSRITSIDGRNWPSSSTESLGWGRNWLQCSMTRWTLSERNKQEAMKKSTRSSLSNHRKKKPMLPFITLRTCHSAGMVNLFLTGSTNSTAWVSSTNARSAGTTVIGVVEPSRCTSKSGGTLTVWNA